LWEVLAEAYTPLGFDALADETFAKLVLARVVEPTSKGGVRRTVGPGRGAALLEITRRPGIGFGGIVLASFQGAALPRRRRCSQRRRSLWPHSTGS
jgi:hypothetical protein